MSGEITKLKIISFSAETCQESEKLGEFEVQVNPSQFKKRYAILYKPDPTPGNIAGSPEFDKVEPETLDLEFTLDGTGVVRNDLSVLGGVGGAFDAIFGSDELSTYVVDKVQELKNTCYVFRGDTHCTPFFKVVWGDDIFTGILSSLEVTYTLFHPTGKPLRAKINLAMMQQVPQQEQQETKQENSPDLTHLRVVSEGDRLDLMCHKIYRDPKYYLEVARANNLTNFRKLRTAETIRFPPIEKG